MTAQALTWFGMAVFLLVILVPFWWIASMSFKTYEQIQFATSIYVPNPFTWENYTGLWTETRFPLWLRNSLVTALLVIPLYRVLAELGATNHLSSLFPSYPPFTVPFCTRPLIGLSQALPDEL